MFNTVRRSQIVGLMAMDSSTATRFGTVEEVWVDDQGRVAYFAGSQGYIPLEQIAVVGSDAVLTYSRMVIDQPTPLRRLHRVAIRSPFSETLGWVEDFLFDWETGDIAAYILGGDIAAPFGGRAVLFPEDVEAIDAEVIVIKEGARDRLKSESEGLKGFLSEKSQQVKNLVRQMGDRLQSLISPNEKPEVVRVKIKDLSNELAASGQHDKNALQEATQFLQDKWEQFQQSLNRTGQRMKSSVDAAWNWLTRK
ncbi:PRC-barrel domain-containing protein [Leptothermofonsia sp. ETS-13]|uniref:PRC-barrel domain-containing protein n=1 Tax=Leptothermofonsia sp. ETS-13 TaxID=3035696 RepID=UPI003BA2A763